MLIPAEEAFLKSSTPGPRFLEGSNRLLSGMQMLISAFEEVAAIATRQAPQVRASREIHDRLQGEIARLKGLHEEEKAALHASLDVARDDLQESLVREKSLQEHVSFLEGKNKSLAEGMTEQTSRADAAEEALAEAERKREQLQASFLTSPEFKAAVEDRAYPLFKTGFNKCRKQFEEAGLLPKDKSNFPDFRLAIASLPKAGEEEKEDSEDEKDQPGSTHPDIE
ncbi:uncharacterized protein LOC142540581 [Primulina tabacum]|uniref:uncharacterized protein LOC142540581 n=1 Tax=Primulina tabacum TaxID=48773 RepID=UPI003F5A3C5E